MFQLIIHPYIKRSTLYIICLCSFSNVSFVKIAIRVKNLSEWYSIFSVIFSHSASIRCYFQHAMFLQVFISFEAVPFVSYKAHSWHAVLPLTNLHFLIWFSLVTVFFFHKNAKSMHFVGIERTKVPCKAVNFFG